MNTNTTHTISTKPFTASITKEVPPRLAVEFGEGNVFKLKQVPCKIVLTDTTKQIKVHIGDKTVAIEEAESLASSNDYGEYGTFLTFREVTQNNYQYRDKDGTVEIGNLSQITIQMQNSSLFAKFNFGGTVPVVPLIPGSTAPVPVGQAAGVVNAPVNVQPVVAVAAIPAVPAPNAPSQDKLTGSLTGLMPVEWELYTNCLQQPHLSYTAQYQEFLQKEKALLASKSNPFSAILPPPAPCGTGGKAVPVVSSPAPAPGVVNAPAAVVPVFDFGEFARKLQAGEIPAPGKQAKQNQ